MGSIPKRVRLNPNWDQLKQKLKSRCPNPSKPSIETEIQTVEISLGKGKQRPVSEPVSAASVLTPTSTDCSLTDAIAMDCEMVGVGSQGNKSALGRVTLVNTWGNIIYDEYVHPVEHVVDFRTEISGIRPHHLRKAKDFRIVQTKVAELIKGRILVGHALHHDLKALLLSHSKEDMRDTADHQPFLSKEGRRRALRDLAAQFLGIKIQQKEHCPVEDARAVMLIYQKNKKVWERSVKRHLKFKKKCMNHRAKERHTEENATKLIRTEALVQQQN
eukprot:TRINITY_DN23868_c0_g1_i1.p1 TRINITY_DN23868_c0_g1~~TRINITY_DN23868_c0_g1_i1.p1  ORF type:complete len:299 (-),score=39.27 TRINITY_DN23868_c0_g1_i1:211-1032(-)